jgi:titin
VVGGKRSHALTSRAANRRVVVVITGQSASSTGTTTAPAVPSAPTITQVQAADHSVTLDFTAPATTGSSAVTGYEYSSDGWSWHPLTYSGSGPLTATLSGLAHSTTYLMAVRGVNALGSGASSNEVLVTTAPSPAAAPSLGNVFASALFGPEIYVSWPVPLDDGGSSITGYQYQLDGGDWTDVVTVNSPVSGMASISQGVSTPLTCGAPASVALRAVTAVGPGFASAPMTTTVDCSEM